MFNAQGEVIGIVTVGSVSEVSTGYTTHLRLGEPSIKAWIEEHTQLPTEDLPPLSLSRTPAGISVSWGATAVGWTLQTSEDLTAWNPVGSTITGAGEHAAPLTATGRAYFRLAR